jgi:hypothetical protein
VVHQNQRAHLRHQARARRPAHGPLAPTPTAERPPHPPPGIAPTPLIPVRWNTRPGATRSMLPTATGERRRHREHGRPARARPEGRARVRVSTNRICSASGNRGPYCDVPPEDFPGPTSRGYGVLHEHERPHAYSAFRDLPPRPPRVAARSAGRQAPGVRPLQVHEHEQLRRPVRGRLHGLRPDRRRAGGSSVVLGPDRPTVRALLGTVVGPGAPVVTTRRHRSSSCQEEAYPLGRIRPCPLPDSPRAPLDERRGRARADSRHRVVRGRPGDLAQWSGAAVVPVLSPRAWSAPPRRAHPTRDREDHLLRLAPARLAPAPGTG